MFRILIEEFKTQSEFVQTKLEFVQTQAEFLQTQSEFTDSANERAGIRIGSQQKARTKDTELLYPAVRAIIIAFVFCMVTVAKVMFYFKNAYK